MDLLKTAGKKLKMLSCANFVLEESFGIYIIRHFKLLVSGKIKQSLIFSGHY